MPTPLMKKYAQQAGTTLPHVEKIWDHAKKSAGGKFKAGTPRYWAYVNGIVRRALKLNEEKTTFKDMMLMELFDSKVDYKVTTETAKKFSTRATIGSRDIVFLASIESETGEDGNSEMYVEFREQKKEKTTYRMTGKGDEIKVFSMIGASIKEAVARYKPDVIHFTAEKDSRSSKGPVPHVSYNSSSKRADLYEKLVRKYIPGYEPTRRDIGGSIEFRLIKKE